MSDSILAVRVAVASTPAVGFAGGATISAAASSPRLAAVEWLRLLAIAAVVYLHLDAGPLWLAMTGVMCFVVFMVAFSAASPRRKGPKEVIVARAQRLLVPWIAWSAVYIVVRAARMLATHEPLSALCQPWMLLAGTSVHLWFLPWAFCVTVVVGLGIAPRRCYRSERAWWVCILVAIFLYVISTHVYPVLHRNGMSPAHLWVLYSPAVAVGLVLARIQPCVASAALRLTALVAGVGLAGLAAAWCGYHTVAAAMTLSTAVCALAWRVPLVAGPWTLRIGGLSYGIYIVHLLVARAFSRAVPGIPNVPNATIALLLSALLVFVMQRTLLRRLV